MSNLTAKNDDKSGINIYLCKTKTTFVSVPLSHSYGYVIYNIPELCCEFRVVNVGFIMALLQRDYSCQHQLIIQELVLETSLVP